MSGTLIYLLPKPFWLEIFVLKHSIKAGTLLDVFVGRDIAVAIEVWTEVPVTEDDGIGIFPVKLLNEGSE